MVSCADRIYQNRGNEAVLKLIPPGKRILDCGCGAGDNARWLSQANCSVVGITISTEEVDLATRYCSQVVVADLELGLPELENRPFDIVLASHVLEHLSCPERVLRDVKRVLAPSGMLIVALPNVLYYRNRLDFLTGRFEYTETGLMDRTHLRFYTYASGRQLLESSGFHIVDFVADGSFPLWVIRDLLPPSLVHKMDTAASKTYPGLFAYQNIYVAQ